MIKGIYFLDKNADILSDIESFFVVNDTVCYRGGCGLLQQAKDEVSRRNDIDIIVITDNLVDASCVEALKAFMNHPAKKIVALRNNDQITKEQLSKHATVIAYPFSCNILEETIKRMGDAPIYSEDDLDRIAESNILTDNPFSKGDVMPARKTTLPADRPPSFRERLKSVQLNRYSQPESRVIPQKVIAVHSQKGGVGKTTISRELAISTSCVQIKNEAVTYRPRVCLCDFDFEASDIAAVMDIENNNGIMTWCEDIEYEVNRGRVTAEKVRFTENSVKERYLIQHESGVYVLCAPMCKTDCFKIDSGYIEAIIENLKLCDFDVIVMDTGPNILDYTLTALSLADEIYAVCNCDMLSARRIDSMMYDIFSKISGFDFGKVGLVVNKLQEKTTVSPNEISKALNIPLVGEIPYYPEIVEINNEGASVFLNRRKQSGRYSDYAEAFRRISRVLVKESSLKPNGNNSSGYAVDGLDVRGHKSNLGIFRK